MKVIFSGENLFLNGSVVTVGTFDGIHRGHQKVIDFCKSMAQKNNCHFVVYTFFPHPRLVLGKGEFKNIHTQHEKLYLFERLGVEYVYIQEFTRDFSQKTARQFVEEHLLKQLVLRDLVVGYDHQFGKDREGSFDVLKELAKEHHFNIHKIEALYHQDLTISSTKIRMALESGNLTQANKMLGYPFLVHARVMEGLKLGRKLGFPTANLWIEEKEKIIPSPGVYVVMVEIDTIYYKGVLNIGYRPSIDMPEHPLSIEVHLLDFKDDIYGKDVNIFFMEYLRGDIKFDSLDALSNRIAIDVQQARELFDSHPEWLQLQNNLFLFNK